MNRTEAKSKGICICRKASDPLKPGAVLGVSCAACGEPIQITPYGVNQVTSGGLIPLCQSCGLDMAKRCEASGQEVDLQANPAAITQLVQRPETAPKWLRQHTITCSQCHAPIRLGEKHECAKAADA